MIPWILWITTFALAQVSSGTHIQNPFQTHYKSKSIFHLLTDFSPQNLDELEVEENHPQVPDHDFQKLSSNTIEDPPREGLLPGFFNDLILTIEKVSRIYDEEKSKINIEDKLNGTVSSSSDVFSVLLTPSTISKVINATATATGEDEILEELTAIILGAESRDSGYGGGGHGLTLDPVTVIALLTLAAYLIRAVYQILIANMARSLTSPSWMELAEMAQGVVTLQSMFDNTENLIDRMDFNLNKDRRKSFMDVPGDLAAAGHLWMDEKEECLQTYFCQQLKGKTISNFGLSELILSLWSVLRGDFSVLRYMKADARSIECYKTTEKCSGEVCKKCQEEDMAPAKDTKAMFRRGTQMVQTFMPMVTSILKRTNS